MSLVGAITLLAAMGVTWFLWRCYREDEEFNRGLTPLQRWKRDQDEREEDRIW